jgi:two-component system, cell cycle sensor histidine kinase and response regulator CckA
MEQQTAESKTDSKTILVVDDDEAILKFISGFLPQSGFNVLVAGSSEHALEQSKAYNGPIDLLLTNLQMPGMTGIELGTKLTLERPDIRVMLMSGFESGMLVLNSGWQFLSKPFVASQLRESILNVLALPSSVDVPDIDERKEMIPR